jgi:CHAT domain-containing protein/tetratricopeptide (TPR) repeat protein
MQERPVLSLFRPSTIVAVAIGLGCVGCAGPAERVAVGKYEKASAAAEELSDAGRFADAELLYREALEQARKFPGKNKSRLIAASQGLGTDLKDQGRLGEAETLLRSASGQAERWFGPQDVKTADAIQALANVVDAQDRFAEAEVLSRKALAILRSKLGEHDWRTADAAAVVAGMLGKQARFEESERMYRPALAMLEAAKDADPLKVAAAENNFAYVLNSQSKYAEAEPYYREALRRWRATLGDAHPLVGSGFNNLASNLGDQGRYNEAEPMYRRALEITVRALGENHPQVAARYNNLADALEQLGRVAEGLEMERKAYAIWRSSLGDHPNTAVGAHNLGASLMGAGKLDEAEPLLREAYRINVATYGADDSRTAMTMDMLSELLVRQQRLDEALQLRRRAADIHVKVLGKSHRDTALVGLGLTNLLIELKRFDEAETVALDAVQTARRARSLLAGSTALDVARNSGARTAVLDPVFAGYLAAAAWLPPARQTDRITGEVFLAAQDLLGIAPSREMAEAAVRRSVGNAGLATLVRRQQDLVADVRTVDADLLEALSNGQRAEAEALQGSFDTKMAELSVIEARLDREFPRYRELVMPPSMTLNQVKSALKPDEGLLLITAFNSNLEVVAVTPAGSWWIADDADPILELATRLRCDVDMATCPHTLRRELEHEHLSNPTADGSLPFDLNAAHTLYTTLVGQFEPELKKVARLYVVTTPNLGDLPLELLVTSKPGKSTVGALQRAHWLGDRFAMTYLPSVSALRLVDPSAGDRGANFLGYGDPVLHGSEASVDVRGFTHAERGGNVANVAELARLQPLPGTRAELSAMGDLFGHGSSIKLGSQATERNLRADPALIHADVLTFATHALLPDPDEGIDEPGLVLTPPAAASAQDDGLLTASEVTELSLGAQWVILSACNTASPAGHYATSGLSGLSRAFLFAGARSLLASHWRVADETTAVLTVEALRYWKSMPEITRAQALQKAMRAVRTGKREDGTRIAGWTPDWVHPSAWAPFTHIANHDD